MAAVDRLSALPDAVLTRVLSFLTLRDVVRSARLSRRWRTLWRQADAVNLYSRDYPDHGYDGVRVGQEFFRDALAAVGADGRCPVRKLSVHVDSFFQSDFLQDIVRTSPGMNALLAAPATQRLEELHVRCTAEFGQSCQEYVLPPPLLLVGLWLQGVSLATSKRRRRRRVLLRCPNATVSVAMVHCHRTHGVYLDAPGVRSLRYKGFPEQFPLSSTPAQMTNLLHMELSFCKPGCSQHRLPTDIEPHAVFWESIGRFRGLRLLRLKIQDINGVAVHPDQEEVFLRVFPDLKFLELRGCYDEEDSYGAAAAIANLLQCSPSMEEFHIKCKVHADPYAFLKRRVHQSDERKAQLNLEKSFELLKRIKSKAITSSGDDRGDISNDVELSALRSRSFHCLDHCLRKIRIDFNLERFSCFQVKLAKFFVENAVVLEEMEVHDGDQRVCDHIHHKLAGWRANSSKRKIKIIGEHSKGSS